MGILSKIAGYGMRALKIAPKLIVGTDSDAAGKAIRASLKRRYYKDGSIFTRLGHAAKAGVKELESGKTGKAFIKDIGKQTITLPKFLYNEAKIGRAVAKSAGKNGIWGAIKGFGGGIVKKMPLIGALATIAFEAPDIIKAGKEQGAKAALADTCRAAAKLIGGSIGSIIGAATPIPGGAFFGYIAGEYLTGLLVGKSYAEKKADEEEAAQEQEEQAKQAQQPDEEAETPTEEQTTTPEETQKPKAQGSSSQTGSTDTQTGAATGTQTGSPTDTQTGEATGTQTGSTADTQTGAAAGATNPISAIFNPFGSGMMSPTMPIGSDMGAGMVSIPGFPPLAPGENIFEKYPMGFTFQYIA